MRAYTKKIMESNPYSAPATTPQGSSDFSSAGAVSAAAVQQLAATKPWVRFMSVITFVCAGFMLIAAAGMVMMGSMGAMSKGGAAFPFTGVMGFGIAVIYAALSLIYIFPGVKLWKYANAIGMLIQSGREGDLVAALNHQRSFWKFVGILVLSMLVLYLVIIVFVTVGGVAAASRSR